MQQPQYPPPEAFTNPNGDYCVLVKCGRNLPGANKSGDSDPYVSIRLNNNDKSVQRTAYKDRTVNPEWNEEFIWRTSSKPSDALNFHVWDHEKIGKNKPLGEAELKMGFLQPCAPMEVRVPLSTAGEIILMVTWFPHFNIPPPSELYTNDSGRNLTIPISSSGSIVQTTRPRKLPTEMVDASFAGVRYHVEGDTVPALTIEFTPFGRKCFFEHNTMLWKHPSVVIGVKALDGGLARRVIGGLPVFLTEAGGNGAMGFSRDGPGQLVGLHMGPGQRYHVREHQFLACTNNVHYSYKRVRGAANMFFGNSGFFMDTFDARNGEGILFLHAYGNLFNKYLAPGEQIEVEPGSWVYMDATVHMDVNMQNLSSGLFGSFNFITNKFTGPGNVGIQSMYLHQVTEGTGGDAAFGAGASIGAGLLNLALSN